MRDKWTLVLAAVMVAALAGQAIAGDQINMKPGKWEITSAMQIPGMPAGMPPMSVTQTQCLQKDELIPQDPGPTEQGNCQTQDIRFEGDTVIWKLVCDSEEGKITSSGRITYQGTSFEGEVKTRIPGQDMEIPTQLKGRWIGPCN
jgi:hypothetical protein